MSKEKTWGHKEIKTNTVSSGARVTKGRISQWFTRPAMINKPLEEDVKRMEITEKQEHKMSENLKNLEK